MCSLRFPSPARPLLLSLLGLSIGLASACGDDVAPQNRPDAGDNPAPDGSTGGGNDGVLPPVIAQSGVAYVGHFLGGALLSVRTDTAAPELGPSIDLGSPTHAMVLDDVNDRLVVISDVARSARVFSIERPATAGAAIAAPSELSSISFTETPRFAAINPYRDRLYVLSADSAQNPLTTMTLHAYDLTDPASPVAVAGWPKEIPVTVSFALDPVRDVLFLIELTTDVLHAYDLGKDNFDELGGTPIDLEVQFPQENQASFQPRSLTADFRNNRLLAARSQSALSELIYIDYPADIPTGEARYRDFASLTDLAFRADGFDVDLPLDERSNLLDAYEVATDPVTGAIFMSADAWNGSASMAIITAFGADGSLKPACNEVPDEDIGCFLRGYVGGAPVSFQRTDGAMCVDGTNRRVVTTSVNLGNEEAPGQLQVFDFAADLSTMAPALPADGGSLVGGPLSIEAVCH